MTTWIYARGSSLADLRRHVKVWSEQRHVNSPDDVALVVSELVTNAVVHAHAETVTVRLERQGVGVLVSVDDPSTTFPMPANPKAQGEHGRGLRVVEALTVRWGCTALPRGKRVWCEMR